MDLTAQHFVGGERSLAGSREFRAVNPATGERLEPIYLDATDEEIDQAISLAADAHEGLKSIDRQVRAAFLEEIAQQILDLGDPLIERTSQETGLPSTRLVGERGRTVGQLRLFAEVVRDGSYVGARIDHGDPERQPLPKPDVRRMLLPLGPVAIFGASNFPLAFSVAGGDTASALAAGCPVIVKAHPHHPGASEMVAAAIARAIERTGLPEGTFSLIQGASHVVGMALVRHPLTTAIGFTGSLGAGRAIFDAASSRSKPIPVFAEMGSSNPLFLLPDALASGGAAIAEGLAGSVTLGVGQFCTKPGLVFVIEQDGVEEWLSDLASRLGGANEGTLLHIGIRRGFDEGVARTEATSGVELRARSAAEIVAPSGALPTLLVTDSATFRAHTHLQEEIFGPATLVVRCHDANDLLDLARRLDGQLTATLHATDQDLEAYGDLVPILEEKAGRLIFGGYPTGVEVCHAMQHGGPYPSTTAPGTTSVGTAAIERWLRPVAYQNMPASLLPAELRDDNPEGILRLVDGAYSRD